ncbi:hypothetical protein PspS49_11220 [Pseudomonas sp. S49]|nr:hypothetical protein PspS49_11220 [Pseudomonas sp. S49]
MSRTAEDCDLSTDRSLALRGNAAGDALRPMERGASLEAFPRRAWERSTLPPLQNFTDQNL